MQIKRGSRLHPRLIDYSYHCKGRYLTMIVKIGSVLLDVEYDYYPGYRGRRDSMGVPQEPDEDPEVDLTAARVGDVDILGLMSMESMREIERIVLRGQGV
jgi:hypothetical protein